MGFDWEEILGDGDLQEAYNEQLYEPEYDNLPCTTAILPYFANGGDIGDDEEEYVDWEEEEEGDETADSDKKDNAADKDGGDEDKCDFNLPPFYD